LTISSRTRTTMVAAATQQPLTWCTSGAFFRSVASSSRRCLPYNKRQQQQRLCDAASSSSSSRPGTLDMRRRCCCRIVCEAEGEEGKTQGESRLGSTIRNKQRILESKLRSMPAGELEAKLSATRAVSPPNNLLDTIAQQILQGRTAIIVEAARLSPAESPESLAQRCANYVTWGKKTNPLSSRMSPSLCLSTSS
jgi:hypothetical protein